MARKERKERSDGPVERSRPHGRTDGSNRPVGKRLTLDEYGRLARLAREASPPPPLVSYALGSQVMTTLHVAVESKLAFDALRAEMRAETGWPITQPGMFAVLVEVAARYPGALREVASATRGA